jgi:hypothetical protein
MKTISADGVNLISGSANKDQNTMYGSFREQQIEVYDVEVTKAHDNEFEREWNDRNETGPLFTGYDFSPPSSIKGFNGRPLNATEFIRLLRNIVAVLYDAASP